MRKNGRKSKEIAELDKFWQAIPEEARDELMRMAEGADSEEEFLRTVFVGDCPRCESQETAISGSVDEDEDLSVGACKSCGYLWCLECECELQPGTECGHWAICETCDDLDEKTGTCQTSPDECGTIQAWLGSKLPA